MAYNGWKNWQTWNVALWFGNDEGLYIAAKEWAHTRPDRHAHVEAFVRNILPSGTPDMTGPEDYGTVDWPEIAKAFYEF